MGSYPTGKPERLRQFLFITLLIATVILFNPQVAALSHCEQLYVLTKFNQENVLKRGFFLRSLAMPRIRCMVQSSLASSKIARQREIYLGVSVNAQIVNLDLKLDLSAATALIKAVPTGLEKQVFLWQRDMVKTYNSGIRTLNALNPFPGLSVFARARSPAFPYIFIETIDETQYQLGTFPFLDDESIKNPDYLENSYGIGITTIIY